METRVERENRLSLERQSQRRIYNQYAKNLISPEEQKYLSDLKTARATGYFNNTEDTRKAKEEIRRLEAKQDQNLEQLNQGFDQIRETSSRGGNNNQDVSRGSETSSPTFAERGSMGAGPTMSEREAASGLNLAGNDTMSGRGEPIPTMSEREESAGLTLAGNNTTSGRDFSGGGGGGGGGGQEASLPDPLPPEEPDTPPGTIGVILCVNGTPFSASLDGQLGGPLV